MSNEHAMHQAGNTSGSAIQVSHHRFGTLDTLRGLAALAVVVFHVEEVQLSGSVLPCAYLAVDFFFILSGFVVAYTYEPKLRAGMRTGDFLLRRAVRLYPMALVAVGLGGVVLLLKAKVDPSRVDPVARIIASFVANIPMLPNVFGGSASRNLLFPGNPPLWSIAFEIFINVAWCLAMARAGTALIAATVGVSFGALVALVFAAGTANLGYDWPTLWGGLARVLSGFGLGTLIYRLRSRLVVKRHIALKATSALLLVGIFLIPHAGDFNAAWDLVCIGVLMPCAVVLGLNGIDHHRLDDGLGRVSYPLYAVHFPILLLASGLHQKAPQLPIAVLLTGTAVVLSLSTWMAMRFCDEPVRRALTARFATRS